MASAKRHNFGGRRFQRSIKLTRGRQVLSRIKLADCGLAGCEQEEPVARGQPIILCPNLSLRSFRRSGRAFYEFALLEGLRELVALELNEHRPRRLNLAALE